MEYAFPDIPPSSSTPEWTLNCPDLVREYCRLAAMRSLSAAAADRLDYILRQAETDGLLNFWITEVDHFLAHELQMTSSESIYQFENRQAKLREYSRSLFSETSEGLTEDCLAEPLEHLLKN